MTDNAPVVSALVVNYGSAAMVERLLSSLGCKNQQVRHEVLVVDNPGPGGPDGDLEEAVQRARMRWKVEGDNHTSVTVIRSPDNIGFGRGNNLAAASAAGAYLAVLNPDTHLPPGSLDAWLAAAQQAGEGRRRPVGLVAPILLNDNGHPQRSVYRFVGPMTYWAYHSIFAGGIKTLRKSFRSQAADTRMHGPLPCARVDWVMGAAMLLPKSTFDAVGGFDPAYFLYAEDADLCFRLRKAGYDVLFAPSVAIHHTQGEPGAAERGRRAALLFDGVLLFLARNASVPRRWAVKLCIVMDMALRLVIFGVLYLLRRQRELQRSRIQGVKAILRKLFMAT